MRPAKKGRIGTIMVTPTKLPTNDSPSPLMRTAIVSTGLLAFGSWLRCRFQRLGPAPRSVKRPALIELKLSTPRFRTGQEPVN
jgi:hypothetical protein